ncbi:MAG: FMN-binding protein [Defluviitaleaceae bacterium]|nr:FMN-binding protein [Defluviitaleaceae bacterium]
MSKKKMSKGLKRGIIIGVAAVLAVGGFFAARLLIQTAQYRRIISEIELQTPDLSRVADGTFNGFFDSILVSAEVDVVVENGVILDVIILEHSHGNWSDAVYAEVVAPRVVAAQSLNVDTVANATNSSLVILSAIQNALESGLN